jgi:hypothetical protein
MRLTSKCSYTFETIESYVLNRLNKRVRNQFQKHACNCPRCRRAIETEELFVTACRLVAIIFCPCSDASRGEAPHRFGMPAH